MNKKALKTKASNICKTQELAQKASEAKASK